LLRGSLNSPSGTLHVLRCMPRIHDELVLDYLTAARHTLPASRRSGYPVLSDTIKLREREGRRGAQGVTPGQIRVAGRPDLTPALFKLLNQSRAIV